MIRVRFVGPNGVTMETTAVSGARLLDVAQACDQPLEGTCDGQIACSTCHVLVDPADWGRLPSASGDEEDLLDFATNAGRTSRLACQIILSPTLDGLTVRMPGG